MNEKEQQIRIELNKMVEKKKNLIKQYWTIDVEDRDKLQIAYDEIVCLNDRIKEKKRQLYEFIDRILKTKKGLITKQQYIDYNKERCELFGELHK